MAQLLNISTHRVHKWHSRYLHNNALASLVDSEPSDINSMLVLNGLDQGSFTNNLDELLASIALLVDLTDVPRGHGLVERNVEGEVNTTEPRGTEYLVSLSIKMRVQ